MQQTLPPPLSAEENARLLRQAKEGDEEAKSRFLEHNLRLVHHLVKKYGDANYEEHFGHAQIGLIKAFNSFDIEKGIKFATYAARCIQNEVFMHMRNSRKHKANLSLESAVIDFNNGSEILLMDSIEAEDKGEFEQWENSEALNDVLAEYKRRGYSERNLDILMAQLSGRQQRVLAEEYKISQSYVSRVAEKTIRLLKRIGEDLLKKTTPIPPKQKELNIKKEERVILDKEPTLMREKDAMEKKGQKGAKMTKPMKPRGPRFDLKLAAKYMYIFINHPEFSNAKIAKVLGQNYIAINKYRERFARGLLEGIDMDLSVAELIRNAEKSRKSITNPEREIKQVLEPKEEPVTIIEDDVKNKYCNNEVGEEPAEAQATLQVKKVAPDNVAISFHGLNKDDIATAFAQFYNTLTDEGTYQFSISAQRTYS